MRVIYLYDVKGKQNCVSLANIFKFESVMSNHFSKLWKMNDLSASLCVNCLKIKFLAFCREVCLLWKSKVSPWENTSSSKQLHTTWKYMVAQMKVKGTECCKNMNHLLRWHTSVSWWKHWRVQRDPNNIRMTITLLSMG